MEYTYIKRAENRAIDVFHSQEFDHKFIRGLLDDKSIIEVYSRYSIDSPLTYLFTCGLF